MNLNVEPQEALAAGKEVSGAADDYLKEIYRVYSYMDELKTVWKGSAAEKFIRDVESFRREYEDFGRNLKSFGDTLQSIGGDYQGLEELNNNLNKVVRMSTDGMYERTSLARNVEKLTDGMNDLMNGLDRRITESATELSASSTSTSSSKSWLNDLFL